MKRTEDRECSEGRTMTDDRRTQNGARAQTERQRRRTGDAGGARRPSCRPATPEERLAALAAERDEIKDRMLRIAAEFENWKKRVAQGADRRRSRRRASGCSRTCSRWSTTSSARRVQPSGNGAVDGAAVLKGVDLVLRLFKQKLERYEVKPVRGDGPAVRSARARGDLAGASTPSPAGPVAAELQKGYRVGERLLRPALVSVSTGRRQARDAEDVGGLAPCRADYYETLGVGRGSTERRDQGRVPAARAQVAPGSQPRRQGGRGAVQGAGDRRTPCCPTRSKRRHYDRFGSVDGAEPVRGAPTSPARPSSSTRCSAICSGWPAPAVDRRARPALHAGARLRGGGARVREDHRRSSAPRTARLPRHGRRGRHAGAGHLHALRRRGRHPQEGRAFSPAGATAWAAAAPGRCRACAARPARARGWSIASAATRCASRPARRAASTQRVPREGAPGPARRAARRPARHRARAPAPVLRARVDARGDVLT